MSTTKRIERRRHRRVQAAGVFSCFVASNLALRVRDVSLGGFSAETATDLMPGVEHQIRFATPDNWTAVVTARITNIRRAALADGSAGFIAGFSFVGADSPRRPTILERAKRLMYEVRYLPELLLRPWHAPWVDQMIRQKLSGHAKTPVQALVEKAR